jgi:hypothetical protein
MPLSAGLTDESQERANLAHQSAPIQAALTAGRCTCRGYHGVSKHETNRGDGMETGGVETYRS